MRELPSADCGREDCEDGGRLPGPKLLEKEVLDKCREDAAEVDLEKADWYEESRAALAIVVGRMLEFV